jgi:hypothetical protein
MAVMVALLVLVGLLSLPAAQAGFWTSQGYNENWVSGHGTWYGDPYGEGSNGGNCGYTELFGTPYGPKIVAGSPAIYANGLGCGQQEAILSDTLISTQQELEKGIILRIHGVRHGGRSPAPIRSP